MVTAELVIFLLFIPLIGLYTAVTMSLAWMLTLVAFSTGWFKGGRKE